MCCLARYWAKPENRKNFFVEFAKERGFDPEIAENWYSVDLSDMRKKKVTLNFPLPFSSLFLIICKKGAPGMLKMYNGSFKSALVSVFPDIGIRKHKFAKSPST
jgi:hypothetical protein